MNSVIKKILRLIVIIAAGAAIFWYSTLAGYWAKEHIIDPWRVKKHLAEYQEALEAPAKADVYGSTESPQETFAMFMDALRKEDFYLASRYFVLVDQDEWYEIFKSVKEEGNYNKMMADLGRAQPRGSVEEGNFHYVIFNQDGVSIRSVGFNQNTVNHRWKISEL